MTEPPVEQSTPARRGRPRSDTAHTAILDATAELLTAGLDDVTMEAIAARAGVSKATIYKWWPTKLAVALEAFGARMAQAVAIPDTGNACTDFIQELDAAMTYYQSPEGRAFATLLSQSQSSPDARDTFRARFLDERRSVVREIWQRGVDRGELRADIDPDTAMDLIYGPAIFRLLTGHAPLNAASAVAITTAALEGLLVPHPNCLPSESPREKKEE